MVIFLVFQNRRRGIDWARCVTLKSKKPNQDFSAQSKILFLLDVIMDMYNVMGKWRNVLYYLSPFKYYYFWNFPEKLDPDNFFLQCPVRTKIQHIWHSVLKEGNGDHKYLVCLDLWYNSFDFICTSISLDKLGLSCAEIFISKPTGNYAVFITSSIFGLWLDNCGRLLHILSLGLQDWEYQIKKIKVVKPSGKYDILTIQEI